MVVLHPPKQSHKCSKHYDQKQIQQSKGGGNFPKHLKFDEKLLGQFVEELEEVVLMLWFSFVLGLNLISFLFGYDNEFETKENEI